MGQKTKPLQYSRKELVGFWNRVITLEVVKSGWITELWIYFENEANKIY